MLRKELLNELKQLVELEFNVVDEAFAMANEIDLESFSTMTPRAAAVVLTQRGCCVASRTRANTHEQIHQRSITNQTDRTSQ